MPGLTIEFDKKPTNLDEFMKQFPAFIKSGNDAWEFSDNLGTTTVKARELSDHRFVIITNSSTPLHIPWERANKIGKEILSFYKDACRLISLEKNKNQI